MATTTATTAAPPRRTTTDVHVPPRTSRGLWRDAWRRLLRNKLAIAGVIFIGFMVLVAIFADVLSPYDPNQLFPGQSYVRPNAQQRSGFRLRVSQPIT